MESSKYLSNFWRTREIISLINCEITLILTWSANCIISSNTNVYQAITFAVTDAKVYFPVVTF